MLDSWMAYLVRRGSLGPNLLRTVSINDGCGMATMAAKTERKAWSAEGMSVVALLPVFRGPAFCPQLWQLSAQNDSFPAALWPMLPQTKNAWTGLSFDLTCPLSHCPKTSRRIRPQSPSDIATKNFPGRLADAHPFDPSVAFPFVVHEELYCRVLDVSKQAIDPTQRNRVRWRILNATALSMAVHRTD
ncbi:hypothetical protein PsYK624_076260 [Phanerochaete sordida]|uniref:Uncharacterized protein n=1 Tax=Phanerochaete sordida TaxID=48140 RepID=A0A9P3GAU3_9APHY|nr:hypothetical protein PsYK624_076260 [Phanerochaete sordida]